MEINTKEDWWQMVDDQWENLLSMTSRFAPKGLETQLFELNMENLPYIECSSGFPNLFHLMTECKKLRIFEPLDTIFQRNWRRAPDNEVELNRIPGWGYLCDLCSENWVFYEDEQNEDND